MAKTAADILIEVLQDWGVEVVFGMPGDGINGIMEALRTRQEKIRFVQVRHEESAAFMACAHAKYTGKLGVCLATVGSGWPASAQRSLRRQAGRASRSWPSPATTTTISSTPTPSRTSTWIALFEDVSVYNTRIMGPAHVENVAHLACRTALARKGVAHINFPVDLQEHAVGERSPRNVPGHNAGRLRAERAATGRGRSPPRRGRARCRPEGGDPGRPGRAAGLGRARASRPSSSARRSSRRCSARPRFPTTAPTRPAPIGLLGTQALAGSAGGVRHAADRGHLVPLHRVLSEAGAGACRSDRPRPDAHRPAVPGRGRARRRQPREPCKRCCRCSA